ncbi:MAG: hypothetical protein HQ523_15255 [Lentisphaerae bacterium]|nr:hypothetical protein [Lentisphaerota bacterium]
MMTRLILTAMVALAATSQAEESSRFLTQLHGAGYMTLFGNRSGAFNRERYVSEGTLEADIFLFDFTPTTHLVWGITTATRMGKSTTSGLPFSVQEVNYALIPYLEMERGAHLVRVGLDHGCEHLILKDASQPWYIRDGERVLPTVYDNRLFAGFGSDTYRRSTWKAQRQDASREAPHWIHYVEVGYYLQELFGLVSEDALNEGNNWWWDAHHDLRRQVWSGRRGDLFVINRLEFMIDREEECAWRDRIGLEFQPATRVGSAFQLNWHPIDEHPRNSREDLIELVARFFF